MSEKQQQGILVIFLLIAVLAPVAFGFLFFFAHLLSYFGDSGSCYILTGFGAGFLLLWIVDLFGLLLLLGFRHLFQEKSSSQDKETIK